MSKMRYRDALRLALTEEMTRDPLVFVMGEGIAERGGSFKVTEGLLAQFGDRISQFHVKDMQYVNHAATFADAGTGDRVCVDTCSNFFRDEGLLVGAFGGGFLLCCSETHPLPYMPTRPFRVNSRGSTGPRRSAWLSMVWPERSARSQATNSSVRPFCNGAGVQRSYMRPSPPNRCALEVSTTVLVRSAP